MTVTVTLIFDDNSLIEAGVNFDLLNAGVTVSTALTAADGTVTFPVDPSSLAAPAIRLSAQQTPPA
jgi:hypothetical protein